jgi:hypothetical protein
MKKLFIVALLMVFVIGCEKPAPVSPTGSDKAPLPATRIAANPSVLTVDGPYYDGTRRVELYIHWAEVYGRHNTVSVNVGPDEVLVGGGAAVTSWKPGDPGALLTGSYPLWDNQGAGNSFVGWTAESKDHIFPYNHWTAAYAIGMRLKNNFNTGYIPQATVQSCVGWVTSGVSDYASLPTARVQCPPGWLIIAGGARVVAPFGEDGINIYGNYLTESYAEGVTWGGDEDGIAGGGAWVARSKDHIYPSPARIMAYAIVIKCQMNNATIPGFGDMNVKCVTGGLVLQTTPNTIGLLVDMPVEGTDPNGESILRFGTGWLISGVGALDQYNGWGRMLTRIGFQVGNTSSGFNATTVSDQDYYYPDSGTLTSQYFAIKADSHGYLGSDE